MNRDTNNTDFDSNMYDFMRILEENGCVMESDHIFAYSMQYPEMKASVLDWLSSHGYSGNLHTLGAYDQVAVYCLFDEDKISYEEAYEKLLQEAAKQNDPRFIDT
ncbi:hypothetical protein SAMN02910353_03105 [Ruminococcus sp. YRD2003]|uniref:hypothetical protein n=1 Tax=Ruminococcus sp. YRD2003 TaxID=1452313 RepID=UPI0008CDC3D2|nr:hypothetical protein SAMN02910353_03105 [Ruminococcus flavefaciens]